MPRLSLGFNQRNFNGTRATSAAAINMGSMRGKGSTSRMFNYCTNTSPAPSLCINQFINITGGSSGNVVPASRVPVAPFITSIAPGDQELIVNFYEVNDGGSPITDYLYSINNGITFISSGLTGSPLTIIGLTNGTTYDVRLKAVNSVGQSSESNLVSGTPFLGTVPGAPTITFITAGDQELIVNFNAPNNGGSPITNYLYSLDASVNIDISGNFISSGVSTSPILITGLINNFTYQVSIKAVNSIGAGNASNIVNGTPISANQGWSELGANAVVPFTSLYADPGTIRVVKYNNSLNKVYVAGDFKNSAGYEFVAVYDIASNVWSPLGNINPIIGPTGSINALIFDTNNDVYIGGAFGSPSTGFVIVAKYTNSTGQWSEIGNLASNTAMTVNGAINCLSSDGQNRIYAAGNFQYTDSNGTWRYVARYTPNTNNWDRLNDSEYNIGGQQFNGELFAINSVDTVQGTNTIVAGDAISTRGGGFDNPVGVRRVWSYLDDSGIFYVSGAGEWPTGGGGYSPPQMYMFNGPVYALSGQFAGGAFTSDPNLTPQTNNYILANGQWRPFPLTPNNTFIGPTYNGPIRTIIDYYIAGDFTNIDGNHYVANAFNGSQVGNQNTFFNNSILSLSSSSSFGILYAGGNFVNSSGKNFVAIHTP